MVGSCCAFGCNYRYEKGDKVGLYTFPKDKTLCKRWVLAVRRANWWPAPSSRICGKHFLTGRPSKSEFHPDYVPSVFVYSSQHQNRKKQWQQYADARKRVREILSRPRMKKVPGYRPIRPKTEGFYTPYIIRASTEIVTKYKTMQMISVMKENDIGNKKTIEDSNRNNFLICKEITPSLPQRVWVQNFPVEKKDSNVSIEKLKGKIKSKLGKSTSSCEAKDPLYVESSFTVSDDDSTLTAESIPSSEDTVSCMSPDKGTTFHDADVTENDALGNVSSPVVHSVTDNATDSDYSEFKSMPSDTKEILAIKLETMLAVNISLQQKVKIYQSRCKNYEKEVSELTSIIKKLKLKNSPSYYK